MKHMLGAVGIAVCSLCTVAAQADTTINILRVETGDPAQKAYLSGIGKDYEASHPGVKVNFEYLANEAYKSKLPTLLQSDAAPDIFYSWGGQTLADQAKAGFLKDISGLLNNDFLDTIPKSAVNAYSVDDKIYGLPIYATEVVFWVNTDLTAKAGVDHTQIKTWDDFLKAVQKIKDAGITPIVAGGKDKWPLHFYWAYLALRYGGADAINEAMQDDGENFESEPFVNAGRTFQELVKLEPFQSGMMGTSYEQASGMFGDGAAAFHLMGDWDYLPSRARSQSGKGLSDEQLAIMPFPMIDGGEAGADATFGGINGWAVSHNAPDEAADFLRHMISAKYQREAAKAGIFIPIVKGTDDAIDNPFFQQVARDLTQSSYHQIFLDQYLGASVGATVNDISADLAQEVITPEEAAAQIQEAWDFQ